MRGFILAAALAVSLIGNWWQHGQKAKLRGECARLEAELETMRRGQAAGEAALSAAAEDRAEAAREAKKRNNELDALERDVDGMPDADFLCRLRGLCFPNANSGADAAGKPADRLPGTDAARRHEGGE